MLRRVTFYFLCLCISLSASTAWGQTWQSQYDLAVKSYQSGEYDKAMAAASAAVGLLKDVDKKSQAYTFQLITAISLDGGQPAEGLRWVAKEADLFLELEGPKSKGYTEAKCKHARLLVLNNQLVEAEGKCREALDALRATTPAGVNEYNDINFLYAQVLATNNKLPEALAAADQSVEQFARDPEKGAEYIDALFLSAQLSERVKDLPGAEKKYRQLTTLLEKNGLTDQPSYGQAQTSLSRIALASGDKSEASRLVGSNAVDNSEKARQLLKIALDYQSSGQQDLAAEQYKLAEKAIADGNLQNNTAFSVHINYGRLLMRTGKIKDAEQTLGLATKLSATLYQEPSAELAMLNFSLGDLAIAQDQAGEAVRLFEKARSNSKAMTLQARLPYSTNAARKLLARSLVRASIAQLETDIALLPDKSVSDSDFLDATLTYTQALTENNEPDVAITKLKDLETKTTSPESKVKLQSQQASILEQAGRWSAALALLSEINKQPGLPKDQKLENDYLIGKLYLQLGNFGDAEKHLVACAEAIRGSATSNKGLMLDVSNSLAMLYTRLGNYTKAENMYMDLLKQGEPSPGFHASVQQNLAALFVEAARYTEAQLLLEDVLARDLAFYGDQHPQYATSLQNLAAVYLKGHQLEKARVAYEKALQINAKSGPGLSYATTAANLGIVYHQSGNLAKARQYISEALKIREKLLGSEHPDYVFNEYNLAKLLEEMGESQNALPHFRHVASFHLREIKELFRAMSEREKTAYYNKTNEVITAYIDFALKHSPNEKGLLAELYDFRLATKALLLSSSTKVRSRILSSQDSRLLESYTSWITTKEELGKLYSLSAEERNDSKALISSLQEKANQLEKLLTSQSELFSQDASQDTVTWRAVKKSLSPGDAAIEVIRLGLRKKDSVLYAAIVLRPENALPQLVLFPRSPRLESKEFSFYRNSIQYRQSNERSYEYYWKPLESVLKGAKRIYISPDGVFNKVNISTLYDPATRQYLLERHTIELVSNTKELVNDGHARQPEHFACLFGHPNYGKVSAVNNQAGATRGSSSLAREIIKGGIQDLPGTLVEVNRVDAFLKESSWRTSVFTSDAASEKAIKDQKNPGVLHIATHGYFVQTEDDVQVVGGGDLNQSENNPLLRSGLILAGAGNAVNARNSSDDGILTAYEAMGLTLDKTDLVVLSACETGAGEVKNGEGVYGLQRSFLVAGAANLLMSLWKVDDAATQELMLQFYKEMQTTNDKPTAFRATQLEIKKNHPDPYYWGGFVLIGHN